MNPDPGLISLISVISLALIATASILAPFLSSLINDSIKWKREVNTAEM